GPIPDIGDAGREALREQVKVIELAAERALMSDLEALVPAASGPAMSKLEALVEVARVWARVVPRPALAALAERLPA
ncbi:MAG: TIGR02444 family protein, partial [Brevundimonas sp.]